MKAIGVRKAGPWKIVRIIDSGSKPSKEFPSKVIIEIDNDGMPAPADPTNIAKVENWSTHGKGKKDKPKKKRRIRSFFGRKGR
tara:strand:- start:716 stop:964 length:249 start_codon:yes stop_codon:yes gene_type:complete